MQIKVTDILYDKITKEAKELGIPRTQFISMLVIAYQKDKDSK